MFAILLSFSFTNLWFFSFRSCAVIVLTVWWWLSRWRPKYHVTWRVQAEICPNKAWKQLLVYTHTSIKNFCQTYWQPLCSRSSQNDVIYSFPDSFKFLLRLFSQFKLQILGIFQPEQVMSRGIFGLHSLNHHHITQY